MSQTQSLTPQDEYLKQLSQLIQQLLNIYVPSAEVAFRVKGGVFHASVTEMHYQRGADLEPQTRWLEGGTLEWLSDGGQLIGLLWLPESGELKAGAVGLRNMLELLARGAGDLRGAAGDEQKEFVRLLSQLPWPAAWLNNELKLLAASRAFLELFDVSQNVIGQAIEEALPQPQFVEWLEQAARGGVSKWEDWQWFPKQSNALVERGEDGPESSAEASASGGVAPVPASYWLRARMQPFLTASQSGVLLTLQDVGSEYSQRAWVQALLSGLSQPAALLSDQGEVLRVNEALIQAAEWEGAVHLAHVFVPDIIGGARLLRLSALPPDAGKLQLQDMPTLSSKDRRELGALTQQAAQQGVAIGHVTLGGESYHIELRRAAGEQGLLVAQFTEPHEANQVTPLHNRELLQGILNRQHTATLLIDAEGKLQLLNEAACRLLGVEAAQVVGRGALRQLQRFGVQLLGEDGHAFTIWKAPLPYIGELQLEAAKLGVNRPVEVGVYGLNAQGQAALPDIEAPAYLMVTLRDLSELRRAQQQLDYGVNHDSLTGLFNRAGMRRVLAGHAESGSGTDAPQAAHGSMVALHIRGFAGLSTGVELAALHHLLMQLAAGLRNLALVHGGLAARLNESLFALWLPTLLPQEAERQLEPVLSASYRVGQGKASLNFAVGIASFGGSADAEAEALPSLPLSSDLLADQVSLETALSNAEIAAQVALRRPVRGAVIYSAALREQLTKTFRLEQRLRDSVSSGNLGLHYQPVVALRDLGDGVCAGQVVGAEALLRWESGAAPLPPFELLELAARARVLRPLSEWVAREATAQQRVWNAQQLGLRVAVNLSLEELRQDDAVQAFLPLLGDLERAGFPRPQIDLNAASTLDYTDADIAVLERLNAAGVGIWLDNFGESSVSLSVLAQMPLAGIKLHPHLIRGLVPNSKRATLVAASASVAARMGMQMVAVGVESQSELPLLADLGCDLAQGFGIAPPLSAAEFDIWMSTQSAPTLKGIATE